MSSEASVISSMSRDRGGEHFIYVFMAALLIVTAIAGFAPTSIGMVRAISSGTRPMPSPMLHVHTAAMSVWLLLVLAQTMLVFKDRRDLHRKLGVLSFILAPVMLVTMVGVSTGRASLVASLVVSPLPGIPPAELARLTETFPGTALVNFYSIILFPVFYIWAVCVRRTDSGTHKRMMMLATVVLMLPGLGRLLTVTSVLPDFGLNSVDARTFYAIALLAPLVVHDAIRRGSVHRAYCIGIALMLALAVTAHFLFASAWWPQTALWLLAQP